MSWTMFWGLFLVLFDSRFKQRDSDTPANPAATSRPSDTHRAVSLLLR